MRWAVALCIPVVALEDNPSVPLVDVAKVGPEAIKKPLRAAQVVTLGNDCFLGLWQGFHKALFPRKNKRARPVNGIESDDKRSLAVIRVTATAGVWVWESVCKNGLPTGHGRGQTGDGH
jgi:hypothetical protein